MDENREKLMLAWTIDQSEQSLEHHDLESTVNESPNSTLQENQTMLTSTMIEMEQSEHSLEYSALESEFVDLPSSSLQENQTMLTSTMIEVNKPSQPLESFVVETPVFESPCSTFQEHRLMLTSTKTVMEQTTLKPIAIESPSLKQEQPAYQSKVSQKTSNSNLKPTKKSKKIPRVKDSMLVESILEIVAVNAKFMPIRSIMQELQEDYGIHTEKISVKKALRLLVTKKRLLKTTADDGQCRFATVCKTEKKGRKA